KPCLLHAAPTPDPPSVRFSYRTPECVHLDKDPDPPEDSRTSGPFHRSARTLRRGSSSKACLPFQKTPRGFSPGRSHWRSLLRTKPSDHRSDWIRRCAGHIGIRALLSESLRMRAHNIYSHRWHQKEHCRCHEPMKNLNNDDARLDFASLRLFAFHSYIIIF